MINPINYMPVLEEVKTALEKIRDAGVFEYDGELPEIQLERPQEMSHGDLATAVCLQLASKVGINPRELAEKVVAEINVENLDVRNVEVAGPGYINFFMNDSYFVNNVAKILEQGREYGGQRSLPHEHPGSCMVEYTDPNPFKELHIGHLMSNAIGESIARIFEIQGATVKRANYQGDVGMHVAKTIWGWQQMADQLPAEDAELAEYASFLGQAYAKGATAYKANEDAQNEMNDINKKIYDKSDASINDLYDKGRAWSLEYFEGIYAVLGTKFDYYFFESETGNIGKKIVEENSHVFEESEGAIVYRGEQDGLHTRVFINSKGLPTYEAKELGLAQQKDEVDASEKYFVVTGNEVKDYFRVVHKAMEKVLPDIAAKTKHIAHGMLRLPSGKMSSRTGDVITAMSLIRDVQSEIVKKMEESTDTKADQSVTEDIAVGAIKYSILKQDTGKDIVFDYETSLSFTGDTGPYLQYTHARCQSLLRKAQEQGISIDVSVASEITDVERLLERFPEVINEAGSRLSPHLICTYLHELAQAFNAYYAKERIVSDQKDAPYKLALTQAVGQVLKNGLWCLGVNAPDAM